MGEEGPVNADDIYFARVDCIIIILRGKSTSEKNEEKIWNALNYYIRPPLKKFRSLAYRYLVGAHE